MLVAYCTYYLWQVTNKLGIGDRILWLFTESGVNKLTYLLPTYPLGYAVGRPVLEAQRLLHTHTVLFLSRVKVSNWIRRGTNCTELTPLIINP